MSGPSSSLSKDDGGEQVSSHRRASACLPHGDGIEIAFSDLPVKLSPVSPPPALQGAPPPPAAVIWALEEQLYLSCLQLSLSQ